MLKLLDNGGDIVSEVTPSQFAVLGVLAHGGEAAGRDVRKELEKLKLKKSLPAFYQLMARLEEGGLVKGWYDEKVVHGQRIKERRYRLLAAGQRAFDNACVFHDQVRNLAPAF